MQPLQFNPEPLDHAAIHRHILFIHTAVFQDGLFISDDHFHILPDVVQQGIEFVMQLLCSGEVSGILTIPR